MAKADGTYYDPHYLGNNVNPMPRHGFSEITLVGGSGTSTLTILAGSTADVSAAHDITEALIGYSNRQATAGNTEVVDIVDNGDKLSLYKWIFFKAVLATGGVDDADVTWGSHTLTYPGR